MPEHLLNPMNRPFSYQYILDKSGENNQSVAVTVLTMVDHVDQNFVDMVISLQSQSMQNFEWFIIVESSQIPDVEAGLLEPIALDDKNVKILQQPQGYVSTWYQALTEALGRYIFFLDAASVIDPTYIEKCVWYLDSNVHIDLCNTHVVHRNGTRDIENIPLQDGVAYFDRAPKDAQGIVIRGDVIKRAIENSPFSNKEIVPIYLLLSIASSGRWGATIAEHLRWQHACKVDEKNHLNIQALIQEKFPSLLTSTSFPAFSPCNNVPYEALRSNFPVDNNLSSKPDRIHIMLVIPWMVTGGADKFNLDLVEMLVNKGYGVTICATLQGEHPWEYRFANLTPDVFVLRRFLEPKDFPRFLSYLIKSRNISTVMISGSTLGYQLLPYLRAYAPKNVSFLDLSHVEEPHWNSGGHPRFGIGYQDQLDLNIVSTRHLGSWMSEHGADENRIRVLYTGVNEYSDAAIQVKRAEIRREFGLSDDLPVIIFGGRICAQKRPIVLANILNALSDAGLVFYMFVVGDGDQRPMFESLLDQYDLRRVVFMCGSVPHNRWLDLLQASDVFLLPSEYEGISIALLEAMSVGSVPVVSDVGGQKEIVHEGSGYLIPHSENECEGYLTALKEILLDDSLRKQMGGSARALIAEYFSKPVTIESLAKIIAESQHLAITAPRTLIPVCLATELATSAIEIDRLNNTVHWLWGKSGGGSSKNDVPMLMQSLLALRQSKLGVFLSKSKIFRYFLTLILKSSK